MNVRRVASGLSFLAVILFARLALADPNDPGAAACGCLGFFGSVVLGLIALNIACLVWVARDAKNRGMENSVVWMILVMFTGLLGLIIYLFTRTPGVLVPCANCGNRKLQVNLRCPHCGNTLASPAPT